MTRSLASFFGLLLVAFFALGQVRPAAPQLVMVSGSRGGSSGAGESSGLWAADCAAANLHCVPFDSDADITAWLHNGNDPNRHDPTRSFSGSELARFVPNGGCMGTGAVEMEDSEGTDESPIYLSIQTWPSATSGANITAAGDIQDVVPIGTTAWVRYCFSVSQAWLNNDTNWAGNKISSWTGAYNTFTEQETFHMRIGGGPDAPRQYTSVSNTAAGMIWEYVDLGGGAFDLQPGSEYGSCLYATAPTGCYVIEPDIEYAVLIGATLAADTDDTTDVKVYFAKYGDLDWTLTYHRSDLGVNEDYDNDGPGGEEGYSALVLWNRHENHDAQPPGITVQYSNVLMHEGATPPNLPDWDEWVHAPSWFTGETADRWGEIPGSDDFLTAFVAGSFGGSNEEAYNGLAVDNNDLWFCGEGGHAENSTNGCYRLPLLAESTTWESAMTPNTDSNPCSGGVADCYLGGVGGNRYETGKLNDGSKTSDHTFSASVGAGDDCVYFGALGGAWAPSGGTWGSPAVWKWCEADTGNGERGYTYLGLGVPSGSLTGFQAGESASCYDRRNNQVLVLTQNWFQDTGGGQNPNWLIDLSDDSITAVGDGPGSGFIVFCAYIPSLDVFVAGTQDNEIITCDASSGCPTWTSRTVSGTWNTGERKYHFAYSPAAGQILGWMGNTSQLRYITIPTTVSGTWTAGTSNNAGGGDTPPAMIEDGPYSRGINIVPNFGNSGDDLLILWQNAENLVNFQRIDGPRS